ncbi:hypothetical protein Pmani_012023 [Petrolisthes manimaculis]|uniref:Uncharacterized protein n=1 Tax=Petrolisthes manimaculis TaxID=1843537 RepID=A0AAE1Q008_9EUCA|nr:hypothetical protein Pmani_012023 [Petrolisthes manimaculis]
MQTPSHLATSPTAAISAPYTCVVHGPQDKKVDGQTKPSRGGEVDGSLSLGRTTEKDLKLQSCGHDLNHRREWPGGGGGVDGVGGGGDGVGERL